MFICSSCMRSNIETGIYFHFYFIHIRWWRAKWEIGYVECFNALEFGLWFPLFGGFFFCLPYQRFSTEKHLFWISWNLVIAQPWFKPFDHRVIFILSKRISDWEDFNQFNFYLIILLHSISLLMHSSSSLFERIYRCSTLDAADNVEFIWHSFEFRTRTSKVQRNCVLN